MTLEELEKCRNLLIEYGFVSKLYKFWYMVDFSNDTNDWIVYDSVDNYDCFVVRSEVWYDKDNHRKAFKSDIKKYIKSYDELKTFLDRFKKKVLYLDEFEKVDTIYTMCGK